MPTDELEADYVVVGSGAVGMSFVDVILAESDASVIMVDRHAHPGGHWNDAYSFVRLHQPSDFYGVNSTRLGRGLKDDRGPNAGLYELASGDEVRSYFDRVMHDKFLPTERVQYFPMSEYHGEGQVTSLLTGTKIRVRARRKVVDARYVGSRIPSTEPSPFPSASGVDLVPVNELVRLKGRHDAYVIIGAGKTGADACLWLLENGVDPSTIIWVRPRDAWFFNRANFQGGAQTLGSFATQLGVVAKAKSLKEVFTGLEAAGQVMRIDQDYWPTMFRFATTTTGEVELLRQITSVVRLGRVVRIDEDGLILEKGSITPTGEWLYVDCSHRAYPSVRPFLYSTATGSPSSTSCTPDNRHTAPPSPPSSNSVATMMSTRIRSALPYRSLATFSTSPETCFETWKFERGGSWTTGFGTGWPSPGWIRRQRGETNPARRRRRRPYGAFSPMSPRLARAWRQSWRAWREVRGSTRASVTPLKAARGWNNAFNKSNGIARPEAGSLEHFDRGRMGRNDLGEVSFSSGLRRATRPPSATSPGAGPRLARPWRIQPRGAGDRRRQVFLPTCGTC